MNPSPMWAHKGIRTSYGVDEVHGFPDPERLGHASIRTTLDTYGHLFEGPDQGAADALDVAFEAGRAGVSL